MSAVMEALEPSAKTLSEALPKLVQHFELLGTATGGVSKLRELILTLAVQGKLVPQDPSDEPASELLKEIQEAKAQLIAAGTIRREKQPAEIAEEEQPFDLPNGWAWVRLAELAYPQAGFSFKSSGFNEVREGLPLIRIRDVGGNNPTTYFSGEYRDEFIVESGDWLISMDGEFRVREWTGAKALLNQRVTRLVFFGASHFKPFVTAALHFRLSELQGIKAYTTVDHLSGGQIAASVVALPPLMEQSRIVTRVEELMRLCDALEAKGQLEAAQHAQLVQTLLGALTASRSPEELADNWQRVATHFELLLDRPEAVDALEQTILQLAVRGLLVPQDPKDEPASELLHRVRVAHEPGNTPAQKRSGSPAEVASDNELFDVPTGWGWTRIGSVAEVLGGIQKTQLRRPVRQHFPYLRVANVQRDVLRLGEIERFELTEDELDKWRLKTGDLLVVEGNGSADEIGRCAVWDGSIDPCVYQNHLIRVRCHAPTLMAFIKLFLNSPSGAQQMRRLAITSSGLFNLSVGKIRNYVVPLPPLAEQGRIVTRVESLRLLCAELRHRLAARQTTQAHLAEALIDEVA